MSARTFIAATAGLGLLATAIAGVAGAAAVAGKDQAAAMSKTSTGTDKAGVHALTVKTLDGKEQPLAAYRGKVLLVVNTASECGYTPQYDGLEKLWQRYKDRGVVVLGFPSNDFGGQEPGSATEIATFCKVRFGVSFPLFEKTRTRGPEASPLYKLLAASHKEPKWNFHKYLIGKDGRVRAAFPSDIAPESAELKEAIEAALAE